MIALALGCAAAFGLIMYDLWHGPHDDLIP